MNEGIKNDALEAARSIALPSRLAMKIGKAVTGFDFVLFEWLAYVEQRVIDAIMDPNERYLIINVPPRAGKALAVDTPIPTPDGWKSIGDIQTGDVVFGPDGTETEVLHAHAPYIAETYAVTFDDGSTIECDGRHLWSTIDKPHAATWTEHRGAGWADDWWAWRGPGKGAGGRGGGTKDSTGRPRTGTGATTRTASEIRAAMAAGETPRIPNGRIEGDDVDLAIDPYVLGYWLGDGTTAEPAITVGNADLTHVVTALSNAGIAVSQQCRDYSPTVTNVRMLGIRAAFTNLGLLGNKHIPDVYLRASARQRRQLLAGIMDSDGSASGSEATLAQQNHALAGQVAELVASLGGKVTHAERPAVCNGVVTGATVYVQRVITTFNPFQMERKATRWEAQSTRAKMGLRGQRIVKSIEPTGRSAAVRCLTIDHPSALYLAGRQMVPTHNTTYSGVFLPAWFLGMFPALRVIFVSYSDDYSLQYGRAVRTILDKFGKLFGVGVDKQAQSASDWRMKDSFGGMLSTGVGGVLTGYGGNLIIVDDIIKNIQEARSDTIKRMHELWFDTTLLTRLEPGGTLILTATRWADDDLTGRLLERMKQPDYDGPQWEVIALPALAEPAPEEITEMSEEDLAAWTDLLGRHYGESLNPERRSAASYRSLRDGGLGQYEWSCLYQQTPTNADGGMFPRTKWKHWNQANLPHRFSRRIRVWDLATTEGGGDWTVGTLMGRSHTGDLYVIDRKRVRASTGDVEKLVKATALEDGYDVMIGIELEKAGAGKTVVEHYQRELVGYHVKPMKIEGTKEQRATPYSNAQQGGRVWLPAGVEWLEEWKKEHAGMVGNGVRPRHDDQIDTAAYCVLELLGVGGVEAYIPGQDSPPGMEEPLTQERQMELLARQAQAVSRAGGVGAPEGHGYPAHLLTLWHQHDELEPEDGHGSEDPLELVGLG